MMTSTVMTRLELMVTFSASARNIGVFSLSEHLDQKDRDAVIKAGLGAGIVGRNLGVVTGQGAVLGQLKCR